MSIYAKVFLVVLVGTVIGWFAINHAIHSTDRMADTFTTSTTAHLSGREDNEETNMVILNGEEPKASMQTTSARDAIDASLTVVNGNAAQSGNASGATVIIPKIDSKLIARDQSPELNLENMQGKQEEVDSEEDAERQEEEEALTEQDDSENERADSDADMIERGGNGASKKENGPDKNNKTNTQTNKAKKPTIAKIKKTAVQALDMAYALPAETKCVLPNNEYVRIGIDYREGSYAIKGQSLSGIDQLIKIHRQCGGGKLLILQNDAGLNNTDDRLIQLRQDEIKYYLLQRNIPKNDMIFPDSL